MNDTDARNDRDGHRSLNTWLREDVRLSVPRYWLLLAGGAALALILVAFD